MQRTPIAEALNAQQAQARITVCGWVRTRRDSKGFSFLEINDGSCLMNIQVIIDETVPTYGIIKDVSTGASVQVTGELVESPGKGQKWEVRCTELTLFGTADPETFPLQKKRHSDEFLRTIAHLRPRTNKYGAAFRIRSEAAFAVHSFFRDRGFFHVHTPILTGSDCEGAGEMFRVTTLPVQGISKPENGNWFEDDFFGRESNLTVSGQLEAEMLTMGMGRVYTFGPTFRAENSNTPRHAAEFWMIEPEMAFADIQDDMDLGEDMTKYVVRHVMEHCAPDLNLFASFVDKELMGRLETLVREPFARITYTEAVDILLASGKDWEFPVSWGCDLQTEHERYLAEEHFGKPVIVRDYPKQIKAFYMRLNDDDKTVAAMDVLVPRIGELIGGSQREERLDVLEARIREIGQNVDDYWWYLDARRFGTVPHAGFGMGFERLLMLLTGITNIRDVIPFPRTPRNIDF
ncbi:asparagine--tRNA ligase [Desulfovibrio psychrotolerans]|uniref:Asparagine--tRNA ligase n=1 Tax=Desulfovibrio psychrotolerans TaxID=415242 RepID=A0A7J0BTD8_9BACT|nr:asparagine--tRNA ligase [Desulfovibrio psychrotolerans]GFM36395.1 asparagine--tRNA ligase [Desulfovibrio psychrotolerans]